MVSKLMSPLEDDHTLSSGDEYFTRKPPPPLRHWIKHYQPQHSLDYISCLTSSAPFTTCLQLLEVD